MRILLLILTLTLILPVGAAVKDPIYDEFSGLDLVEALIRDGKHDLAETELKSITPSERKTRISGDLAYARQKFDSAIELYNKLSASPQHSLLRARARAHLKSWADCVSQFKSTGLLWLANPSDVILKASCEFQTQRHSAALATLIEGGQKHSDFSLQRERVSLLLELTLSQAALTAALERSATASASDILGLAELFHAKKLSRETLILLEWGRTRYPFDVDVNLSLAKAYFAKGELRATAEAFERAARVDRKFNYHAAELRRQLGDKQTAAYWLPQIEDDKEKLRSRLAFYVDNSWYALIASMDSLVALSPLNQDDEVRYAMSYSLFRQGQVTKPLKYLSQIRSPQFAERAALLKKELLEFSRQIEVGRGELTVR